MIKISTKPPKKVTDTSRAIAVAHEERRRLSYFNYNTPFKPNDIVEADAEHWLNNKLSRTAKAIYLHLKYEARNGYAYQSLQRIADRVGCTRDHAKKIVAQLEKKWGVLKKCERRDYPNYYRVFTVFHKEKFYGTKNRNLLVKLPIFLISLSINPHSEERIYLEKINKINTLKGNKDEYLYTNAKSPLRNIEIAEERPVQNLSQVLGKILPFLNPPRVAPPPLQHPISSDCNKKENMIRNDAQQLSSAEKEEIEELRKEFHRKALYAMELV